MSAFVFPSKAEGFGMPIIEVMKFNKPIIASGLPIFDEVADGKINTFRVDCGENEQVENLARALRDYNAEVDEAEYRKVVEKYAPERLGKMVHEFVKNI
jgi:glycosyltransferase involved in cell wall biosynthesis